MKESKKRKSVKNENMETESGMFVEDVSEDGDKKSRDAIKIDNRSNVADLESDNDVGDINIEKKKVLKGTYSKELIFCNYFFLLYNFRRVIVAFFLFDRAYDSRRR